MDLRAIVLLMLGGVIIYVSYKNEALGAAIAVGVAVVGLAIVLMGSGKGGGQE